MERVRTTMNRPAWPALDDDEHPGLRLPASGGLDGRVLITECDV